MTHQELMDQYQTLDKKTLGFSEYKKALEDYFQKYDALFVPGSRNSWQNTKIFWQDTIKTASAWSGRGSNSI